MMNHKAEIVELISKENVKLAKKLQKTKNNSSNYNSNFYHFNSDFQ